MDRIVNAYRTIIGISMAAVVIVGLLMALGSFTGYGAGFGGVLLALAFVGSAIMALGLAATAVSIHDRQIETARTLERIAAALERRT